MNILRALLSWPLLLSGAMAQLHTYDDNGRLARTTDDTGNSAVYRYDRAGNLLAVAMERDVFVPAIAVQPVDRAIVAGQAVTFSVTAEKTAGMSYQWQKDGANIAGATGASLTLSGVQASAAGGYRVLVTSALGTAASGAARLTVGAAVAPTIVTPPLGQSLVAGGAVRLEVTAAGTPTPTYQWLRNGAPIASATAASLSLVNLQPSDAGSYTVVASNSAGNAVSAAATLVVAEPAAVPVFTAQPASQAMALDSTVVLRGAASGAATYQWRRDGVALPGATQATLILPAIAAAQAGSYTVEAANAAGRVTSTAANVTVSTQADFGRIINLSILTSVSPEAPAFSVGTVLGGRGTRGSKPIVVRAVGPSLAPLGVSDVLGDPRVDLRGGGASIVANDNWGGGAALTTAMAQVGAFPFINATSRDAAVARELATGDYVVEIAGAGGTTGAVIAELYDATRTGTHGVATPRLVNVSVLKQIAARTTLTAGFVIGGTTAKSVLIRAVGPSLATFGVGGFMADPQLALFAGSTQVAGNDNWGGDPQLATSASGVGAFALSGAGSRDAMLLVTLPPGSYTAQVSASDGGAGTALVEVYEVP